MAHRSRSGEARRDLAEAIGWDHSADQCDPFDPLSGTPYRMVRRIGEGGMGTVLEVEDRLRLRPFVLKILHAHLVLCGDLVDRMRLEARSLAALWGHPNIVAIVDSGETADGRPYIVMERLLGRTLRAERRARGNLPVDEALDCACQALFGLAAAHEAGVIHRDIKPANLFLCDAPPGKRRVVKVLDFGIAKLCERASGPALVPPRTHETEESVVVGTMAYLAPEQALGGHVDARTDVYSMGAVLFYLLTGRGPFEHHTVGPDMLAAHLDEAPPLPSGVRGEPLPQGLDQAVLRALAKDPDDRFPDAQSFVDELLHIARAPAPGDAWCREVPQSPLLLASDAEPVTAPSLPPLPWAPATTAAWLPDGGVEVAIARPRRLRGLVLIWLAAMLLTIVVGVLLAEIFQ